MNNQQFAIDPALLELDATNRHTTTYNFHYYPTSNATIQHIHGTDNVRPSGSESHTNISDDDMEARAQYESQFGDGSYGFGSGAVLGSMQGYGHVAEHRDLEYLPASRGQKRPVEEIEDGDSAGTLFQGEVDQQTQALMPTLKRAKTERSHTPNTLGTNKKLTRRESLASDAYANQKVVKGPLEGISLQEALNVHNMRIMLKIKPGTDSVNAVKSESSKWIDAIRHVYDQPYSQMPVARTFPAHMISGFQSWQKKENHAAKEKLFNDETGVLAEASAVHIFHMVVEAHEKGGVLESHGTSWKYDVESTCQQRLEKIVEVAKVSGVIRSDMVYGRRLIELVADPTYTLKRKEDNKYENMRKAEKLEANKKNQETKPRVRGKAKPKTEAVPSVEHSSREASAIDDPTVSGHGYNNIVSDASESASSEAFAYGDATAKNHGYDDLFRHATEEEVDHNAGDYIGEDELAMDDEEY